MKKIVNVFVAMMLVFVMTVGFSSGEDPTYEDGLLTVTLFEGANNAQVVKISDGVIVDSSPALVFVIKLRNSPYDPTLQVIEINVNDVGNPSLPEDLPDEIVIHLTGDSNETSTIDTSIVILNEDLRGEQVVPEFDEPDVIIFDDLRGEQVVPELIHSDMINPV